MKRAFHKIKYDGERNYSGNLKKLRIKKTCYEGFDCNFTVKGLLYIICFCEFCEILHLRTPVSACFWICGLRDLKLV